MIRWLGSVNCYVYSQLYINNNVIIYNELFMKDSWFVYLAIIYYDWNFFCYSLKLLPDRIQKNDREEIRFNLSSLTHFSWKKKFCGGEKCELKEREREGRNRKQLKINVLCMIVLYCTTEFYISDNNICLLHIYKHIQNNIIIIIIN